jgi:Rha family phage regulatory protein
MENLVIIQEEKALTTSLKVAEVFGKQHKHVVRDIRVLMEQIKGLKDAPKFGLIYYIDSAGREQEAYQMQKDGFTLLVMGYTGKKAMEFKISYLRAFEAMEAYIREMQKTILNNDELALIFNLINFFRYLEHCKQIEEKHKNQYILGRLKKVETSSEYGELAKQFYVMRNNLLELGNTKQLQERYKKYCLTHPNVRYVSNADKFLMVFSMDKYEPIRHAIADFLKLELHTDGYTLKLANQAKDLAKRGNVDLEVRNETNLFQEKEEELVDLSKLKYLASTLLKIGA